ncbi:serine/threonine-protein kinase [Modestobacter sp. URMC 112]
MVEPARTSLGNRYELGGLLATGGMGQVWRAQDLLLGRPVAVKVLRSEYTGDPLFRARFRAEAQHAAALSHPNIAAVYDYGEETALDGSGECLAYLVMELVEGESLSSLLDRTGALTPEATLDVLRQTASALGAAHAAGVVHRDVKPGNVLVCEDGTVKITDFGIAWSAGSVPLTQTGQVIGTAAYLSPEAASGSHATPASDVYSLGMVGYECLAGHKAFDGDNSVAIAVRQLRDQPDPLPDDVPAGVRSLIDHCLVKDPAHRIPDGHALVAAVDDVVAGAVLPPVQHTDTMSIWLAPGGLPGAGTTAAGATAAGTTGTSPAVVAVAPAPVRHRLGRVLVPVAALLLGAGIAGTVVQQLAPTSSTGATAEAAAVAGQPSTSSGEPVVPLAPGGYAGRPLDQVRAELEALGLLVQTEGVETADLAPSLVLDLTPGDGEVRRGDLVLIRYAVAPPVADPEPQRREQPSVDTVVDEPAGTTAPPATTEPAPPAPDPAAGTTDAGAPVTGGPTTTEPSPTAGEDADPGTGAGTTAPEEPDGDEGDGGDGGDGSEGGEDPDGGEPSSGNPGNGSSGSATPGGGNGDGATGGSKGRGAGADR